MCNKRGCRARATEAAHVTDNLLNAVNIYTILRRVAAGSTTSSRTGIRAVDPVVSPQLTLQRMEVVRHCDLGIAHGGRDVRYVYIGGVFERIEDHEVR